VLSLDAQDVAGEHSLNISANVFKKRTDGSGYTIVKTPEKQEGIGAMQKPDSGPCGSCYGAETRPGIPLFFLTLRSML
jgi:hypothetical protein